LVILDGLAEAMAAEGHDEDKPAAFLAFCRERLRPFADAGCAVLVSDHVTKNAETRGRWARGSGAKLGRYDGAVYSAELVKPYSPTQAGAVRLRVAKDRNGGAGASGEVIAEVHFSPGADGQTLVEFRQAEAPGEFRPTVLMERVSRKVETFPESSKRDLREAGNHKTVDLAIGLLCREGFMRVVHGGLGRAAKFEVLKPFREAEMADE